MAGTPAFAVVETGDIILAVEGKLVTRFRVSMVRRGRGEINACAVAAVEILSLVYMAALSSLV